MDLLLQWLVPGLFSLCSPWPQEGCFNLSGREDPFPTGQLETNRVQPIS